MSPDWSAHLPPGTPAPDLLADRSLPGSWTRRWAEDGRARVLFEDATGWTTAGELEERTTTVAGRYAAAGLVRGDRLVLSAAASVDLVVAHVAALRLGLVVVPVNGAYGQREVAAVASDCTPRAAVVDSAQCGAWVAEATGGPVVVTGPDVDLPRGPEPVLDDLGPDDPALLVYTSGTTGAPKGAVLSHGNLLASVEAVRLAWRWTPADRLVLALPLFHVHGLGVGLHGTLTAGASAVLRPRFDAADLLDSVREHDASLWFGVPTMYARVAGSPRLGELARLRLCVSGSAPLSPELWSAVAEGGGQRILERYGMTETLMNVSNPYDGERRPGTVGLPLPGVELRLADGTDEVLLRGPNVMRGYWQRPEATAAAFTEDGWFLSGDVGAHDPDGYLRIVGRRKELIISGGYNVYPREVEDVLRTHPGVRDAAVVGRPDAVWGERVTAFVEADGVSEAELLELAAGQLAPYKRPRAVVFVDALPRNALGKVVKGELA
ncbi:MAG: AMP-binding protein [Frankiales bacterium]|nr:AMP-binding protein [Frankiales bacterium]